MDCVFCKIVKGEIKTDILFETPNVIAFNDINPIAPSHILIIPKRHYVTLNDIPDTESETVIDIFRAIKELSKRNRLDKSGYRVIANMGKDAGQEVLHAHIHVVGGRQMGKMG